MPDRTMGSAVGAISHNPAKGVFITTDASHVPEQVERMLADRSASGLLLTAAVALLAAAPAFAEAPSRVRGVVTGANTDSIAVKERDGRIVR
jgi:hypothetical protein